MFKPVDKKDKTKFTVLFPRRIHPARGYMQMAQASKILTEKYKDIEVIFCGKGYPQDEINLKRMIQGLQNVKHISAEMSGMNKIYELADVSVIPTLMSEGTSLSALETLASGAVPIVTWVGGLMDIVQSYGNGIVIRPNDVNEIVKSVVYLYENRNELERMKENGLRMIQSFGKERWRKDVSEIINNVFN